MNSLYTQRVLHAATDISIVVNDYRAFQYSMSYTAGQYLYIGSAFPFNNAWVELGGTVNAVNSVCSVDIWYGNAWVPAVEVFDGTSASAKSLAQSGRIQWTTNDLKGWDLEQRSSDVTGLTGTNIYNMYWCRLSWNATLTANVVLKYIGQKFSDDTQLASHYPDLLENELLSGFSAGKTSWDEQHFMAAEHIIRQLVSKNIVKSGLQLFDPTIFVDASCHKVAEIAYTAFGKPYSELKSAANQAYTAALPSKFVIDTDSDGKVSRCEQQSKSGWMTR